MHLQNNKKCGCPTIHGFGCTKSGILNCTCVCLEFASKFSSYSSLPEEDDYASLLQDSGAFPVSTAAQDIFFLRPLHGSSPASERNCVSRLARNLSLILNCRAHVPELAGLPRACYYNRHHQQAPNDQGWASLICSSSS